MKVGMRSYIVAPVDAQDARSRGLDGPSVLLQVFMYGAPVATEVFSVEDFRKFAAEGLSACDRAEGKA